MEKTHNSSLIADTSGLISLAVRADSNHKAAFAAAESLRGRESNILVPYEVMMEMLNVLGKRVGHRPALNVAAYISDTPLFLIIDSSKEARVRARHLFSEQPEAVSYTDCVVMAVADEYETKEIFGFDTDHERNGYRILSREHQDAR